MKEEKRKVYYLFSPFLRIFHWIMVLSIVTLFITGLLITKPVTVMGIEPTYTSMSMDWVRNIHFIAAFTFCAAFILRIYGYIRYPGDRLFPRVWKGHFYRDTIDVALHYMLLKPGHDPYLRNPLARTSYVGLYVMVLIEILTLRLGDGEHVREPGQLLRGDALLRTADGGQGLEGLGILGRKGGIHADLDGIRRRGIHGDENVHLPPGDCLLYPALHGRLGEGVHPRHLHGAVQISVVDTADLHGDVPEVPGGAGTAVACHTLDQS